MSDGREGRGEHANGEEKLGYKGMGVCLTRRRYLIIIIMVFYSVFEKYFPQDVSRVCGNDFSSML